MANKPRCFYNSMVKVSTRVVGYNGNRETYDGPRQVVCEGMRHCNSCGWNPEVEADRKKIPLSDRKGYVWDDKRIKDHTGDYKGIIIKRRRFR